MASSSFIGCLSTRGDCLVSEELPLEFPLFKQNRNKNIQTLLKYFSLSYGRYDVSLLTIDLIDYLHLKAWLGFNNSFVQNLKTEK